MIIIFVAREIVFGMGNRKRFLKWLEKLFFLMRVVVTGVFAFNNLLNHTFILCGLPYQCYNKKALKKIFLSNILGKKFPTGSLRSGIHVIRGITIPSDCVHRIRSYSPKGNRVAVRMRQ